MNDNNLYYRRGNFIINKLLKKFSNDSTFFKKRVEFTKDEINRFRTNSSLVIKDYNAFSISAITALLGINKENIEKIDRHNDYKDYSFSENMVEIDMCKKLYPEFLSSRNIETQYDDWLSVENCDFETLNYMMNVRNAMLHSEYDAYDEHGNIINIRNSNYTHFKSKAILPGFIDFCIFYFGNNSWTGLSENFTLFEMDSNISKIDNLNDVDDFLKNKLKVKEVIYKLDGKVTKYFSLEKKLQEILDSQDKPFQGDFDHLLDKKIGKDKYSIENKILSEQEILIIKKMLETYYGDDFYNMPYKSKARQIILVTKYYMFSRSMISEWICDYLFLLDLIRHIGVADRKDSRLNKNNLDKYMDMFIEDCKPEINNRSVFVARTSLLFVKLYHSLYRIQNKNYHAVDYNKVNFDTNLDDYSYERFVDGVYDYDFSKDIAKMQIKNSSMSYDELEKSVICEIIRNALSHGNIEMGFKVVNDVLVESVIFEDIYHSKTRKLEITLDKLEKFLESEAFTNQECILKEEDTILKK